MRFFKIRQRFYNAETEGGGQGGGDGGNNDRTNPEDENGQADDGIKKELEAIRTDLKKILEHSGGTNAVLEKLQKPIDNATDDTAKQELIKL